MSGTFVPSSITVAVFEKNGLKRGPALTDAFFRPYYSNMGMINSVSGGGPIAGGSSVFTVNMTVWRSDALSPGEVPSFRLLIGAGRHYEQDFYVRNGDNFEVRLDRIP
jgi:hypothetical protein